MREFTFTYLFPAAPEDAFDVATRDFEGLEKYIPNIATIRVLEYEPLPHGRTRWLLQFSGEGAIPVVARPVIKPDMVRWDEELICDPRNLSVQWSLRSIYFTKQFHCHGNTRFEEHEQGARIVLTGRLDISIKNLPGFPDVIVRRAVDVIEPFLVKIAEFNLGKFYDACRKRLHDERRAHK